MLPLERQNEILEILEKRKVVTVDELCQSLYSSGATIRRDLALLEEQGQLRRTHGGAVFVDSSTRESPLMLREIEHPTAKSIIAQKALNYIKDGQTLFLDSSTTASKLAERLGGFQKLRVVTNSLKTVNILAGMSNIELYCTGGRLRDTARSFVGQSGIRFLSKFHADYAFLSCRGVDLHTGVTDSSEDETDFKIAYLQNASRMILLCDSSKLGKQFFCKICDLSDVWQILTDIPLPPEYAQHLKDNR